MSDYGEAGAERLSQMRSALGRRYRDPAVPGREERTRSDILRETGTIPSDVTAPADQDMWEEAGTEETPVQLPPPEYKRNIKQSTRSSRAVKRPDLYPEFYDAAVYEQSTRVWAMQWIPTAINENLVIGDLLVVFARTTGVNGGKIFVYPDIVKGKWIDITQYSSSYGRAISGLNDYSILNDADKSRYQSLHETTDEGFPWVDWIWDRESDWAAGRPSNESGTYSYETAERKKVSATIRNAERKKRAASAKAAREAPPETSARSRRNKT